ncbi:hypothetical protein [Aeromonas veronii]|uniref:hypothetical protein n=1 Tax=Aeromonas veronii TaxID=654 RepID=UPI000C75F5B3|nr:hypothetical protein [Aeromonas veronii]AYK16739.1 hypothetical protein C0073_001485 [Aeromonas veronii]
MAKINHVATGAWRGQISGLAQKAIDDAAAIGRELEARLNRIENDRTRNPLEKLPMRQKAAQDAKQHLERTMALAYRFGVERAEEAQKARARDLVPTSDNLSAMTLAAHLMNKSPAEIKKLVQVDPRFALAANFYPPEVFGMKRDEHSAMMGKAWETHHPEKFAIEQAAIQELKALDVLTRSVGDFCKMEIEQCAQGMASAGRVED